MKANKTQTALLAALSLLSAWGAATAAQQGYTITWIQPPTAITENTDVRVDFLAAPSLVNDTVKLLYGFQNGGADPANYPYHATQLFRFDTASVAQDTIRVAGQVYVLAGADTIPLDTVVNDTAAKYGALSDGTAMTVVFPPSAVAVRRSLFFSPRFETTPGGTKNMSSGRFYLVLADRSGSRVSNEAQVIVESFTAPVMLTPTGAITEKLPLFSWTPVPGVPYYHLLLSDQPIELTQAGINNASFIWQAITPGSQIRYGSPDPSGIFPEPPPISPGVSYQWVILNNYGNSKEYTSLKAFTVPFTFTVEGDLGGVYAPDVSTMRTEGIRSGTGARTLACAYDSAGKAVSFDTTYNYSDSIRLSWAPCDSVENFNLYKVYLYNTVMDSATRSDASVVVWTRNTLDTSVTLLARSFLANGVIHEWKVFVENKEGAGVASGKRAFFYSDTATPTGDIHVRSREILGGDTVGVKFVNVRIAAVSGGSVPFDVVTDQNGNGSKPVAHGTYRVTLAAAGYASSTQEVTVDAGNSDPTLTFILEKLSSQAYGTVEDSTTHARIADAAVTVVSEYGDTARDSTDANGSFAVGLDAGSWTLTVQKAGYQRSLSRVFSVAAGESRNIGLVNLKPFTNIISGVVVNAASQNPLINATVALARSGVLIATVRTDNGGAYSYAVEQGGGYSLDFAREGFSSRTITDITVTGNVTYNVSLSSDVGMVSGMTNVTAWIASEDTLLTSGRRDVSITVVDGSGMVIGNTVSNRDYFYSLSVPAGICTLRFTGTDLMPYSRVDTVVARENLTRDVTLREYGYISGTVTALKNAENQPAHITVTKGGALVQDVSSNAGSGAYTVSGLDSGTYTLFFSAQGFVQDSLTLGVPDSVSGSRHFLKSRIAGPVVLAAGTKNVRFSLTLLGNVLSSSTDQSLVKIKSPFRLNQSYRDTLKEVGPGIYYVGTGVTADSVIDIDTAVVTLTEDTLVSLNLPFKHKARAVSPAGDIIELKVAVVDPVLSALSVDSASARVWFRDQNENAFTSAPLYGRFGDTLAFRLTPTRDNGVMQYYFALSAGAVRYGPQSRLFSTFIPPSPSLRYIKLKPQAVDYSSPILLPWNTTAAFKISLQNGSFTELTPAATGVSFAWTARNRTGLIYSDTTGQVLRLSIAQNEAIDDSIVDTVKCRVRRTSPALDTTFTTFISVRKLTVDTILLSTTKPEIYSGEQISFSMTALNAATGRGFDAIGAWEVLPALLADSMDQEGKFRSPFHYFGTVTIKVTAFEKSASFRLPVKHLARPGDSTWATNLEDAGIHVGASVFSSAQEFYFDKTDRSGIPVLKAVTTDGQVISPIYKIKTGTAAAAAGNYSLLFAIPQGFEDQEMLLGRWNQRRTAWEIQSNVTVEENTLGLPKARKSYQGLSAPGTRMVVFKTKSVGGAGDPVSGPEYALLSPSRAFGLYGLKVGPSPFSPFVTCRDAGVSWKGVRVEFDVSSEKSNEVSSEVQVLNLEGDVVAGHIKMQTLTPSGLTSLYSVSTSGAFYGNKTLKRVAVWDGLNDKGRLCRNGRYLVRITVSDGVDKLYKTIPVVLFK